MSDRSDQYKRAGSRETSPLRPQHSSTSYDTFGPVPRPPGLQPDPPSPRTCPPGLQHGPPPSHKGQRDPSPLRLTKRYLGGFVIFLIILTQIVAFAFFYDLPFKVGEYNRAAARMREQEGVMREEAKRMENERIALGNESNRLEKERLALDSSTREMEVERDALESAIHRSELERSRLERDKQELENERQLLEEERWRLEREKRELESERQLLEEVRRSLKRERQELEDERRLLEEEGQRLEWEKQELEGERQLLEEERRKFKREKQLLESERHLSEQERSRLEQEKQLWENERHLSEQERGELRKERERWEKAREDRVPQGAFWEDTWPAWDCRAYGKREYWGILQNIPEDWTDVDACMNMPTEIKGVSIRRPHRCAYVEGSPHIHGYWMVDWDQPDCRPWHQDLTDKGCTNPGSGTRRLEAWVVGINDRPEQDWRLLCESTPMTWNHITYNSPTHCEAGWLGKKFAVWDVPDNSC